jgi:acyl dehydratase
MTGGFAEVIAHTLVTLALVLAYVTLTLHGDDANAVLGVLGGYIGGAGITKAVQGARG